MCNLSLLWALISRVAVLPQPALGEMKYLTLGRFISSMKGTDGDLADLLNVPSPLPV